MKLITFSGVDGSGKSTQLRLLEERLRQEGHQTFYFHAVEFSLANRIARLLKGQKAFVPGQEQASTRASWGSLQLRKLFLFIDALRFRLLRRKLQRSGFDAILSDRYFYDSVINIEYLEQQNRTSLNPTSILPFAKGRRKYYERFIPKPDVAFYMDISAEEIMKRERVPEQGIEYLRAKIELFKKKMAPWGLIPLDASLEKGEVSSLLLKFSMKSPLLR